MDLGLLIIRIVLAVVLVVHGLQWLFGWFDGAGLGKGSKVFERWGLRPAHLMVLTAALAEIGAGLALGLGVLTPIAAAGATATMMVAGLTLTASSGTLWNAKGGGEFAFVLAGVAFAIGLTGAGGWSIDARQAGVNGFWNWMAAPPWWFSLVMLGAIFVLSLPFVGLIQRNKAATASPPSPPPPGPVNPPSAGGGDPTL